MQRQEYPKDYFIKLESNDYLLGRISVNLISGKYSAEIDIVQKESKKIYKHIDILYNYEDETEVIDSAVQTLSEKIKPT